MCDSTYVEMPTFSHPSGTYTDVFALVLSCATEGAVIYYTTDGDWPTTSSPVYTAPLDITTATTVIAFADLDGGIPSEATGAVYTLQCATPTLTPLSAPYADGCYAAPLDVLLACDTPDVTYFYTTDGSTPSEASAVASELLTLEDDTALTVIAWRDGFDPSEPVSDWYTLNQPPVCTLVTSLAHRTLTATATADDPDGNLVSLVVRWGDGTPDTAVVSGEPVTHTYTAGGSYQVLALATDDEGLTTESDPVTVVIPAQQPPSCAVSVVSVTHRTLTVIPTATAGDAPLVDLSLWWEGTPDGPVTAGCVSGQSYPRTYPPAGGTVVIRAQARDSAGETAESLPVQVVIPPNTPPSGVITATLAADHRTLTLSVLATDDVGVTGWRFRPAAGASWQAGVLGAPSVHPYPQHGTYTVTVEITDTEGAVTVETLTVAALNTPPTGALHVAVDGPLHVTALPLVADTDGTVATLTLDWGEGAPDIPCVNEVPLTRTYAQPGTYTLTLTAVDDDGAVAVFTQQVRLTLPPPPPPAETVATGRSPGVVWQERGGDA